MSLQTRIWLAPQQLRNQSMSSTLIMFPLPTMILFRYLTSSPRLSRVHSGASMMDHASHSARQKRAEPGHAIGLPPEDVTVPCSLNHGTLRPCRVSRSIIVFRPCFRYQSLKYHNTSRHATRPLSSPALTMQFDFLVTPEPSETQ